MWISLLPLLAPVPDDPATAWTRFRGPEGTGVLEDRTFPDTWDEETNIAWAIDVPGSGWSSPIVLGDRVYLSTTTGWQNGPRGMATGARDPSTFGRGAAVDGALTYHMLCYRLGDGELLWGKEVGSGVPEYSIHVSNTYATESPTTDGERLFVTFGGLGHLIALDLEGEELWRVDTGVYKTGNNFGWGTSLVSGAGLVFLQNENQENSFLAAFDAETGEERWRAERGKGSSWGTPVFWNTGEREQLVALGPGTLTAYEPRSGEVLWAVEGAGGGFSASPTFDEERFYAGNSGPMSRGPLLAVPSTIEGTIDVKAKEPGLAWKVDRAGPGFASLVVDDGLIYVLGSTAILACYDSATGERIWRERLPDAAQVVASPWIAGDQLFLMDETGLTFVIKAGREYALERTNKLEGLFWGTPSVAGDALLLREAHKLYCIR